MKFSVSHALAFKTDVCYNVIMLAVQSVVERELRMSLFVPRSLLRRLHVCLSQTAIGSFSVSSAHFAECALLFLQESSCLKYYKSRI